MDDIDGIIALTSYFEGMTRWNGPFQRLVWDRIKQTGKDWRDLTLGELEQLVNKAKEDFNKETI